MSDTVIEISQNHMYVQVFYPTLPISLSLFYGDDL